MPRAFAAADPHCQWTGRTAVGPGGVGLGYPGVSLTLRFTGTGLTARIVASSADCWFDVRIDGRPWRALAAPAGNTFVTLAEGLKRGEHLLSLVRRTESWQGVCWIRQIVLSDEGELLEPPPRPSRRLLFIGDSITAGGGVELMPPRWPEGHRSSNARLTYGMELGRRLDAEVHLVAYGGRGLVRDWQGMNDDQYVNAPRFFERAMPDDPLAAWDHSLYAPHAVGVCLGTNDFNLGIPEEREWVARYNWFLGRIRQVHPAAGILLINSPMHSAGKENGDFAKAAALEHYLDETVTAARKRGDDRVRRAHVRHQPGTKKDSHPTAPQHQHITDDLEPVLRAVL